MNKYRSLAWLLRISCFIYLFSRGALYTFSQSPWRSLLWHEDLVRPFVKFFGGSWINYAQQSDSWIKVFEKGLGITLMSIAFIFLFIRPRSENKWLRGLIAGAGFFTIMHLCLQFLGHNREFNMIPEYTLQALTPWIFLALLKYMPANKEDPWIDSSPTSNFFFRFAIASCFLGHGLYAAGIPYQPASYNRMLSLALNIDFETASQLVTAIGIIDIVLAVSIFIKPLEKITLLHMVFWGLITAGSRALCYVVIPGKLTNINPWLLESFVRISHGTLPLVLFFLLCFRKNKQESRLLPSLKKSIYENRHLISTCSVTLLALATSQQVLTNKYDSKTAYRKNLNELMIANSKSSLNYPSYRTRASRANSSTKLAKGLFHKNEKGVVYSDEVFNNASFPVRLMLDAHSDENLQTEVDSFQPFHQNKKIILASINSEIIASYQKASEINDANFDEAAVFKFVKKVFIFKDGEERLHAKISAPWLESKWLLVDITQHGEVVRF